MAQVNNNTNNTILSEHRRVVNTRYILSIMNFVAVLLGMIVTLFFVSRRGIYDAVLTVIWALIIINAVQIALCVTEFVLRSGFGITVKFLPIITYAVGGLWIIALVLEMVLATVEAGTLRTDLLIVAVIQAVVAIIAYILWPGLDRRAIDSMIKPSSRGDAKKRAKKAKGFVAAYGFLTVVIVLAQAATLLLYKMPPTFYDLFADNRALAYELNEDKTGYVVSAVYNGTSPYVNVPATYNNLPVVGIKAGALVDDGIIEKYKITSISFGTAEKDENGNEVIKSNLQYISSGAIVCARLESLVIPQSVVSIDDGAVRGDALRTVEYSAKANFNWSVFNGCQSLSKIIMSGESVGVIASLEGMPERVNIQVDKEIYNSYREANLNYVSSFSPILGDDEFCIDFFTGCDYYIDSIFAKKGESVKLNYAALKKDGSQGIAPAKDTLAYIQNENELGTDGAKANSAFRGWYYDAAFVEEVDFTEHGEVSFTESTKIYAKWINEYNATLNWGSHKPDGQIDKVYWTEEDLRSFPVVTDRIGYSAGVEWKIAGTDTIVVNSGGIVESVALNATWLFDAPGVAIAPSLQGGSEIISVYGANFTYDEEKSLQLAATQSHVLQTATGIPNDKKQVEFDWEWYKDGVKVDALSSASIITLRNVAEAGTYTLRVIAVSPYNSNETSYTEVNYTVTIGKKNLDIGQAGFGSDIITAYDGKYQTFEITNIDTIASDCDWTYSYTQNGVAVGNGVRNVGDYEITATFTKRGENAANYNTVTRGANITITPIVLASPTWSGDDGFVYNKAPYSVTASFEGILNGEDIGIVYENATATAAGTYKAKILSLTNENYTLNGASFEKEWTIDRKPVSENLWYLDGDGVESVAYNGASHRITASISGVCDGDEVGFLYSGNLATNAGSYTAEITGINGADSANYVFTPNASSTKSWAVAKKVLNVSVSDYSVFVYNGAANFVSATVSGFVSGDAEDFVLGDFNYETNATAVRLLPFAGAEDTALVIDFGATNVLDGGYGFELIGFNSESENALLSNYTLGGTIEKTFRIDPKPIEVRPAEGAYAYNGREQNLFLYVDGVVAKDRANISFAIGEGGSKVEDTTNGVFICYVGINAGSYPTSVTAVNDPNYTLVSAYTTPLVINKKNINVASWTMFDKAQNKLVDWKADGYTYNKAGFKVGYTLAGVVEGENVTLALTGAEQVNASNNFYTTSAVLDTTNEVNKNYAFSGDSAKWKINPKSITLTWKVDNTNETSFVYNKAERKAEYTVTGLIEGDGITLDYKSGEGVLNAANVGDYKITVTSIANDNYTLAGGQSFEWSITPKPVDLVWKLNGQSGVRALIYNGEFHNVAVAVSNADIITGDSVSVSTTGNTTAAVVNDYTVTATGLNNANYQIKTGAITEFNWEINARPIEVLWDGTTEFIYNGKDQHPKATITNLCDGDVININYSGFSKNVGPHSVRILTIDNGNYTFAGATGIEKSYKIVPKVIVPVWTSNAFVYNAAEKAQYANPTYGAASVDDGKVYNGDTVEFEYENNQKTAAGTYVAKVIATGNDNYVLTSDTAKTTYEWSIAKCPVTLTWSYSKITYNSNIQYPVATVSNKYGQSVKVTTYSGTGLSAVTKGNYSVTAGGLDNSNFTLDGGSNLTQAYSIAPLTLTYEWYGTKTGSVDVVRDIDKLVYDGFATTLLVRFTNLCEGDNVVANYENNEILDAGSKTVSFTISGTDAGNYSFASGGISRVVTVAPQPVRITWSGNNNPTYNGQTHKLTVTVVGTKAGADYNVAHTVTPSSNGNADGTFTNAGEHSYTVALTGADAANFTLTGAEGAKTAKLTIAQKPITVTWGNLEHTYDGNPKTATASSSEVALTLSGQTKTTAGNYTVTVAPQSSNYKITNNSAQLVIKKAKIDVTFAGSLNLTYDGAPHALTVTITNASGTGVVPGYSVKYNNSTGVTPINAGDYTVAVILSDTANFEFKNSADSTRTLSIAKKVVEIVGWTQSSFVYDGSEKKITALLNDSAAQETLLHKTNKLTTVGTTTATVTVGSNYEFKAGTVTTKVLEITPATVSVSWWDTNVYAVTYDKASHFIRATLSSDTGVSVPFTYTYNGQSGTSATTAGTYNVQVVLGDANNFKFATGADIDKTLTINKKVVTVTWPTATTFTYKYGTSNSFAPTLGGKLSNDTVSFSYSGVTSATDAGTYKVVITGLTGAASGNYTLPTDGLEKTFVVNPQKVKLTWSGLSFGYDGNAHKPTLSVIGLDDSRSVSFRLSGEYTNAGKYDIGVELTNSNYTLVGCQGETVREMEITPRKVTISWTQSSSVVYDGREHSLTPTVTGVSNIQIPLSKVTVEGTAGVNVGNYTFKVTGVDDSNYTVAGVTNATATLTILKRDVSITWQNLSKTYGMMDDTIVFATLQNVVYGEDVYAVVSGFSPDFIAGTHTLTVNALAGADMANYQISSSTSKSATLTVNRQKAIAIWTNTSYVYDGTAHAPTLTVTSESGEVLATKVIDTKVNAGSYTYSAADYFEANANYQLENATCTLEIEKMQILATNVTVSFNNGTLSVTFNDLPANDAGGVKIFASALNIKNGAGTDVTNGNIDAPGRYSIRYTIDSISATDNYEVIIDSVASVTYTVTADQLEN